MVRDRVCGSAQGGFDGRDDEQRPVVTSGVTLAGHLITDLDPIACEGIGAQPGTPGWPAAPRDSTGPWRLRPVPGRKGRSLRSDTFVKQRPGWMEFAEPTVPQHAAQTDRDYRCGVLCDRLDHLKSE
jgi:hypothetical protein